jgi:hypothetical protein
MFKYVSSRTLSIFLLYFKYRYTVGLLRVSYIYIYIYIPGEGKCVTHERIVLFKYRLVGTFAASLVGCRPKTGTLKKEAVCSSEALILANRARRPYIAEGCSLEEDE